ncbi:hypothetical protein FWK35_00007455, partial [Aphis craccivora]
IDCPAVPLFNNACFSSNIFFSFSFCFSSAILAFFSYSSWNFARAFCNSSCFCLYKSGFFLMSASYAAIARCSNHFK